MQFVAPGQLHAPGSDDARHCPLHPLARRLVYQHQPGVDEVEGRLGQRVGGDVVLLHRKDVVRLGRQEARTRSVASTRPVGATLSQPAGDRAASGADLQARPAGRDAQARELLDRPWVQQSLQLRQPALRRGSGVVEDVARRCLCHDTVLRPSDGRPTQWRSAAPPQSTARG